MKYDWFCFIVSLRILFPTSNFQKRSIRTVTHADQHRNCVTEGGDDDDQINYKENAIENEGHCLPLFRSSFFHVPILEPLLLKAHKISQFTELAVNLCQRSTNLWKDDAKIRLLGTNVFGRFKKTKFHSTFKSSVQMGNFSRADIA